MGFYFFTSWVWAVAFCCISVKSTLAHTFEVAFRSRIADRIVEIVISADVSGVGHGTGVGALKVGSLV
jgi:hypothetical protein